MPSDLYLKQARAAVARSGASRSGAFPMRLIVKLASTDLADVTASQYGVEHQTLQTAAALGTQPQTAKVSTWDKSGTHAPSDGQALTIADGHLTNPILVGTVVRTRSKSVPTLPTTTGIQRHDVDVIDGTWLFNRRTITKQYPSGTSGSAVAVDIVNAAIAVGFTVTAKAVQSDAPLLTAPLVLKAEKFGNAMTRLCQALNPNWYWAMDPNGVDVHFFLSESYRSRVAALVPGLYTYDRLAFTSDFAQLRSRVYGEGTGGSTTAPVAVGATSIPVDECAWYDPTQWPGGNGRVYSTTQGLVIFFTGRSATSGPGNITGVPASGLGAITVALTQSDQLNVWTQTDDTAAQTAIAALEGGDGVHESYVSCPGGSAAVCVQQSLAELAAYKAAVVTGTFWTSDRSYTVGRSITIALPQLRGAIIAATVMQVQRSILATGRWQATVSFGTVFRNIVDVMRRTGRAA